VESATLPSVESAIALTPTTPTQQRLMCVDPTASTDASFAKSIKDATVASVGRHVPSKPGVDKDGVAPIAGVDLTVRLVGTAPMAYGAPIYRVHVAAVPGLPARPDMTVDGALDPGGSYARWKGLEKEWSSAYDQALAAQQSAVDILNSIDLGAQGLSGITGCVSALAEIAPSDGDASFLVASDLEETVAPQSAGSMHNFPVVVIQPNPSGDAQQATNDFDSFAAWATTRGAGPISHFQPEVADSVINSFINGG
jgi:hypothetical protein